MDPITQAFAENGKFGVILFVIWKLAVKALSVWKSVVDDHAQVELKKLDQQHEQYTTLAGSIGDLGEKIHENTVAVRELTTVVGNGDMGTRVARIG